VWFAADIVVCFEEFGFYFFSFVDRVNATCGQHLLYFFFKRIVANHLNGAALGS